MLQEPLGVLHHSFVTLTTSKFVLSLEKYNEGLFLQVHTNVDVVSRELNRAPRRGVIGVQTAIHPQGLTIGRLMLWLERQLPHRYDLLNSNGQHSTDSLLNEI
jgi:hypothetical protein